MTRTTISTMRLLPRVEAHLQEKLHALFAPAGNTGIVALHDMRVASRRLRVALRCFASLFPEQELKQVQRQLRRTTQTLGNIRALDVNLQLLRTAAKRLPASTAAVQRKLAGELLADRVREVHELGELQRTFATSHFEERIRALVLKPRLVLDRRLLEETHKFIAKRRRVVQRRFRKGADYHKLRIAAKRYRYALETGAAVFRVQPIERVRAVEALQDRLGEWHDLEVLLDFLRTCRRRWTKAENPLAGRLDAVLAFFETEHEAVFAKCQTLLNHGRTWLKKVRLELLHD
jgi:CHAD domain-containing protein